MLEEFIKQPVSYSWMKNADQWFFGIRIYNGSVQLAEKKAATDANLLWKKNTILWVKSSDDKFKLNMLMLIFLWIIVLCDYILAMLVLCWYLVVCISCQHV
jgi:hypothetical protein